jgi:hypothetical protein
MSVEIVIVDSIRHFVSSHPSLCEQAILGYLVMTQDQFDRLNDDVRSTLIPYNKILVCQITGGTA